MIFMPTMTCDTPLAEEKEWSKEDCDNLMNQIKQTHNNFMADSDRQRSDVQFQNDSATTLYLVDRATDVTTSLVAGSVFRAIRAIHSSRQAAQVHSSLKGPGWSALGESSRTAYGTVAAYSAPLAVHGAEQGASYLMGRPFACYRPAIDPIARTEV